jgi:hypothetical protein
MKSVRVVAVGLLLAAYFMVTFGSRFFAWWTADTPLHAWVLATTVLNPIEATAAGLPLVGGLTFAVLCVGAGLLVSGTVYVMLDDLITGTLEQVADLIAWAPHALIQLVLRRMQQRQVRA